MADHKFKVPYSVVVRGEFEVTATSPSQAVIRARRWLSSDDGINKHKTLMEMGAGNIRIHGDNVEMVEPEVPFTPTTMRGGKGATFGSSETDFSERRD